MSEHVSSMRAALRVLSILALVAAADLAITLVVLATSGVLPSAGNVTALVVTIALDAGLGILGIAAAKDPSRALRALPAIVFALIANAVDVVLAVSADVVAVSAIVSALIVAGIAFAAHMVNYEYLRDGRRG